VYQQQFLGICKRRVFKICLSGTRVVAAGDCCGFEYERGRTSMSTLLPHPEIIGYNSYSTYISYNLVALLM
jgi:hypothetical protein